MKNPLILGGHNPMYQLSVCVCVSTPLSHRLSSGPSSKNTFRFSSTGSVANRTREGGTKKRRAGRDNATGRRRRDKYRKGREQRGFEGQRGKMEWEVEYIKFECHSLGLGNC